MRWKVIEISMFQKVRPLLYFWTWQQSRRYSSSSDKKLDCENFLETFQQECWVLGQSLTKEHRKPVSRRTATRVQLNWCSKEGHDGRNHVLKVIGCRYSPLEVSRRLAILLLPKLMETSFWVFRCSWIETASNGKVVCSLRLNEWRTRKMAVIYVISVSMNKKLTSWNFMNKQNFHNISTETCSFRKSRSDRTRTVRS